MLLYHVKNCSANCNKMNCESCENGVKRAIHEIIGMTTHDALMHAMRWLASSVCRRGNASTFIYIQTQSLIFHPN